MARKALEVGDVVTMQAFNTHLMDYTVIGFYDDGRPKTHSWNAQHSDRCPCHDSDDYEPIPDW